MYLQYNTEKKWSMFEVLINKFAIQDKLKYGT